MSISWCRLRFPGRTNANYVLRSNSNSNRLAVYLIKASFWYSLKRQAYSPQEAYEYGRSQTPNDNTIERSKALGIWQHCWYQKRTSLKHGEQFNLWFDQYQSRHYTQPEMWFRARKDHFTDTEFFITKSWRGAPSHLILHYYVRIGVILGTFMMGYMSSVLQIRWPHPPIHILIILAPHIHLGYCYFITFWFLFHTFLSYVLRAHSWHVIE